MFSPGLAWALAAAAWIAQISPTEASLRGLAVVSPHVVWASGAEGTWLLTTDGGAHWKAGKVAGAEALDFRDVAAWDAEHALLLASGEGAKSRIYRTNNGGRNWELLFSNPDAHGFFDAFSFWDRQHGLLLGDPVDGHFAIYTTSDGGENWQATETPPALPGEGAFAASGTCLTTYSTADAWFVTGGGGKARVFHSADRGRTWTAVSTPLPAKAASAGGFSIAFRDVRHGAIAGGDYKLPNEPTGALAWTDDGGQTWRLPPGDSVGGYRSAIALGANGRALAVGASGSDVSIDGGAHWKAVPAAGMNAVAFAADGSAWALGAHGAIAKLVLKLQ